MCQNKVSKNNSLLLTNKKKYKIMKIQTHFENHQEIIIQELLKAHKEVYIAVAWINFKVYKQAFLELLNNKVELNIICSDNTQNRAHKREIIELQTKGAKIKLLKMPLIKNHMHHKFAVIDNQTIINGSFNWSPNATKSFENFMVITGFPGESVKFIEEFKKLYAIETATIKALGKLKRCPDCSKGKIANILVFSSKSSKYGSTSGDIVQACSECDYYENNNIFIENNDLFHLADAYNSCENNFEREQINSDIFSSLNQYINNQTVVHAVGKIYIELDPEGDDYSQTIIIWKNKYAGDIIRQYYDNDFDVHYDQTSFL